METMQCTETVSKAGIMPKTEIQLGVDELTFSSKPSKKVHPDDWQCQAEDIIKEFLQLSKIEDVLGILCRSGRSLVQGYTQGFLLDEAPYYFCICYNQEQPQMYVCAKFSATAWATYKREYAKKFNEDMNVVLFLRRAKSPLYTLRLSRIDFTADYFNYPSPFEPDACLEPDMIYRQLERGRIKVCDYKGKSNIKTISALNKNHSFETIYIGSRRGNTPSFLRVYNKRMEQLEKHGFRYQEACECSSWIRFEAVYKGIYAHQISDAFLDEQNTFTPDDLTCFIASKIADKYRFMDTATSKLLNFSEELVEIASGIASAPLSCPSPRDNSLRQSLEWLLYHSGLLITLAKVYYVYSDEPGAESKVLLWILQAFHEFYLNMINSPDHTDHPIWQWLSKHKNHTKQQELDEILMLARYGSGNDDSFPGEAIEEKNSDQKENME